jgi:pimeloyl-ACP methyl ester carboxylesterase
MLNSERESAIVPIFQNENNILHPKRTYVCFGVARGGTSAIAGTMQRIGIFMGADLPNNYEDANFGPGKSMADMRATIAARNADHTIWGWKFPAAANYLENLHTNLRNPYLIVVFRDAAATMKAHVRWHNRDIQHAAHEILIQQQKNWFLLERWRVPTLLISYEKAVLAPKMFARQLAQLTGMPEPGESTLSEIEEFLAPGSYK